MPNRIIQELSTNPETLKHFDLLKSIGIWDSLDQLNTEVNTLEELLREAIEIFHKQSVVEVIDYVTGCLLNKFIPAHLCFVLQASAYSDETQLTCFRNMKKQDPYVEIPSLSPFESFFSEFPSPIAFSLLEYKINETLVTDALLPLEPEIVVPIMGIGGFHGFIVFGRKVLEGGYSQQEISYIDTLMKFTSVSLQNNIHHRGAITDTKTGLYNHTFLVQRLDQELARVRRYDHQMALMILDVDHFKKFNDTYGHLAGDEVLIQLSRVLMREIRCEDLAARFGGEEFVVMLLECNRAAAWAAAERIRKAVEEMTVEYNGEVLKVTVSVGLTHLTKDRWFPSEDVLNQADQALYESKSAGRNRSSFFQAGLYYRAARAEGDS